MYFADNFGRILYFNEKVLVIKTIYKFSKFSFITIQSWSLINKKISIKHEREIITVFLTMTHIYPLLAAVNQKNQVYSPGMDKSS